MNHHLRRKARRKEQRKAVAWWAEEMRKHLHPVTGCLYYLEHFAPIQKANFDAPTGKKLLNKEEQEWFI